MVSRQGLPGAVTGLQTDCAEPPSQSELVFAEVTLYRTASPLPLQPFRVQPEKPQPAGGWSLARTDVPLTF